MLFRSLLKASEKGYVKAVTTLLLHGADPNAMSKVSTRVSESRIEYTTI